MFHNPQPPSGPELLEPNGAEDQLRHSDCVDKRRDMRYAVGLGSQHLGVPQTQEGIAGLPWLPKEEGICSSLNFGFYRLLSPDSTAP